MQKLCCIINLKFCADYNVAAANMGPLPASSLRVLLVQCTASQKFWKLCAAPALRARFSLNVVRWSYSCAAIGIATAYPHIWSIIDDEDLTKLQLKTLIRSWIVEVKHFKKFVSNFVISIGVQAFELCTWTKRSLHFHSAMRVSEARTQMRP